jgi:hypothetical protein
LFLLDFFSVLVLSSIFQAFECTAIDGTSWKLMTSNPASRCSGSAWILIVVLDVLLLLIYFVLAPICVYFDWKKSDVVGSTVINAMLADYQEKNSRWMMLWKTVFKFLFVLIRVFPVSLDTKMLFAVILVCGNFWLETNFPLYKAESANFVSLV